MDLPVTTPVAFVGDTGCGGNLSLGLCFLILPIFLSQSGALMWPLWALPSRVQRLINSEGGRKEPGVQFIPWSLQPGGTFVTNPVFSSALGRGAAPPDGSDSKQQLQSCLLSSECSVFVRPRASSLSGGPDCQVLGPDCADLCTWRKASECSVTCPGGACWLAEFVGWGPPWPWGV